MLFLCFFTLAGPCLDFPDVISDWISIIVIQFICVTTPEFGDSLERFRVLSTHGLGLLQTRIQLVKEKGA